MKDARKGPRRVRGRGRAGRSVCIYTADSGGVLDWHFQVVWVEAELANQSHSARPGSPGRAGCAQELPYCGAGRQ